MVAGTQMAIRDNAPLCGVELSGSVNQFIAHKVPCWYYAIDTKSHYRWLGEIVFGMNQPHSEDDEDDDDDDMVEQWGYVVGIQLDKWIRQQVIDSESWTTPWMTISVDLGVDCRKSR